MIYGECLRKNCGQGFTIVEFIIIIILVSVVASYASIRLADSVSPGSQARQLAAQLRFTQTLAMTHGQDFQLILLTPNGYQIADSAGNVVPDPVTGDTTTALKNGLQFGTISNLPNQRIAFDGLGIPYTDAVATTALTNTASIQIGSYTIQIAPITGSITTQ